MRNSRPLTVSRRRPTTSTWTSSRATRRGPWSRAGGPRWRRPHPTSAIDARRTGISSVNAPNKCKRTVRSRGRGSGITSAAVVGGVLSGNGAPATTPPRTAMLSVRNSRSFARTSRKSSKAWLPTWRCCIPLVKSTCPTSGALTWRNRLRRRRRRLPLSRLRSVSPSAPNALHRLR